MRESVKNLLKKTILFRYNLPNGNIDKTSITTSQDHCYSVSSNEELAELIYNGIVEYALGEKNVDLNNLDLCQRKAIKSRLRYKATADDVAKKKYGFFGDVVLELMLQYIFSSSVLIAKGFFYNPLDASEPKGYDSFQFFYNNNQLFLLLGEAKFYTSFNQATQSILGNLSNATSSNYLNTNFLALIKEKNHINSVPTEILQIINDWEICPDINIYEKVKKYNIKLLYPMLILSDSNQDSFDKTIKSFVETIESKLSKMSINIEMDIELFFILIPVDDANKIKEEVIECVSESKPLL